MSAVVLLLVVGVVLLFLETFLPGGVAGVVGFLCLLAAVVAGYRHLGPQGGTLLLAAVMAGGVAGVWAWLRYFPESRAAARFISRSASGDTGPDLSALQGVSGHALTQLRPSGVAMLDGRRVDVVAESALIEKGAPVRVVQVEGSRVVVRSSDVPA